MKKLSILMTALTLAAGAATFTGTSEASARGFGMHGGQFGKFGHFGGRFGFRHGWRHGYGYGWGRGWCFYHPLSPICIEPL